MVAYEVLAYEVEAYCVPTCAVVMFARSVLVVELLVEEAYIVVSCEVPVATRLLVLIVPVAVSVLSASVVPVACVQKS